MEATRRSALKLALSEFCLMLVVSIVWNFVRKTNWSLFDEIGVSAITALFIYVSALK
jgi:hypothetical protein